MITKIYALTLLAELLLMVRKISALPKLTLLAELPKMTLSLWLLR